MSLLDKKKNQPTCPKCETKSGVKHCKSPKCTWHLCMVCAPSNHTVLVFHGIRYFVKPGD